MLCLISWAIFFALDPSHRKRDMVMAARAAIEEVLTIRVIEQMKATDLTDIVDAAARASAAELVNQTIGGGIPTATSHSGSPSRTKFSKNGRKPEPEEASPPNV